MNKITVDFLTLFMWILLLLQEKFFSLIPVNAFYQINGNQQQVLMLIILLITFFLFKGKPLLFGCKSTNNYIIFFVAYYCFELLYSMVLNKQGLLNAFIASNFYLFILFYFFVFFFLYKRGVDKFYKIVIEISTINIIICWLQYFTAKIGIFFTKIDFSNVRFGSLRIGEIGDTLTTLGIFLCLYYFLNNKDKKWQYFIIYLLGILGNMVVAKGRLNLIALVVCSLVYVFLSNKEKFYKIIVLGTFLSALLIFFNLTPIGKNYLDSFSNTETDTASIRVKEINYYKKQNREKFLFGVGFIRDIGDEASDFLKGPTHEYSRTDVGIWGVANAMGIIAVIWYVLLTINLMKKLFYIRKNYSDGCSNEAIFMIFSIICIPTKIFLSPFTITTQAILMGIIDYKYLCKKDN